jgi:hypothetical protein
VVLCVLIASLVLSASITFRQEYRWLYPGYIGFLVLLSDSARCWEVRQHNAVPYSLLCCFLLCEIPRECVIRNHRENFYQYSTCQTANALYEVIMQSPKLRQAKLITIGGDEVTTRNWVFMDGMFSRYYHFPPLQFLTSTDLVSGRVPAFMVRYDQTQNKFFEMPKGADVVIQQEYSTEELAKAKLVGSPEKNLSTPNGTRLVPFSLSGNQGIALVAPVELQLHVETPEHSRFLYLSFSHLWKNAGAIQLEVDSVNSDKKNTNLLSTTVSPLKEESVAEWMNYRIALPYDCKTIMLRLEPATGNQSSTWAIFRQFLLK